MKIIESLSMVERVEDWSRVRSPGRARRRLRLGHRQNIAIREVPRKDAISLDGGLTFTMHPVTARECRRILDNFARDWSSPLR